MKIILAGGAVVIVALAVLLFVLEPASAPSIIDVPESNRPIVADVQPTSTTPETGRVANPSGATKPITEGKLKADTFTGTLQKVNTGCFSDGECYIVVDGKHVTAIMGWSQQTVGKVLGVAGFGDLENYIGKPVEVYAQVTPDNKYTLYGSEGFYIKLVADKGGDSASVACVVGGCSSQLCTEGTGEPLISTCEYREVYACYKTATCARQATGKCGWTDTPALKACIASDGGTTSGTAI